MIHTTQTQPKSMSVQGSRSRSLPKPLWTAALGWRLCRGYVAYRRTGQTSKEAAIDLRRMFRLTNGRANDMAATLSRIRHGRRRLDPVEGVLGSLDAAALGTARRDLRSDGLWLPNLTIPSSLCARLRAFAEDAPCRVHPALDTAAPVRFRDHVRPRGTAYHLNGQALHEQEDIQRLCQDASLLGVARAYLGCEPVFMGASMWWSTDFSRDADDGAAQRFHFDMSQFKFLKIFVYLTPVDEHTGPHVYVRRTHGRLPASLRHDRRFTDEEVFAEFDPSLAVRVTGQTGTVFAADTRGLHKGTPIRSGHRLLLQFLYATDGFGGMADPIEVHDGFRAEFLNGVESNPRLFGARFHRV